MAVNMDELVSAQAKGYSLQQAFYRDLEIFERDIERIHLRHWLAVGHESLIPDTGNFFVFDIVNESLVIVRGDDGTIRALVNVCRHRGSRVCLGEAGTAHSFVCPYHAWTCGLDGSLLNVRQFGDSIDKGVFKLSQVRVVEGLICVSFATNPPDLSEAAETFTFRWGATVGVEPGSRTRRPIRSRQIGSSRRRTTSSAITARLRTPNLRSGMRPPSRRQRPQRFERKQGIARVRWVW